MARSASGSDTTQGGGNISASGSFHYSGGDNSTTIEKYNFSSAVTTIYDGDANSSYTLVVSGKFAGGSFSLDSTFDDEGSSSYHLHIDHKQAITDGTGTLTYGGGGSGGYTDKNFNTSNSFSQGGTITYGFSGNISGSYDADSKSKYDVHALSSFANGTWSLYSFTLDVTDASNSYTFQQSGLESVNGNGSDTFSGSGGGNASFQLGGNTSFTSNSTSSGSYSGSYNGSDSFSYKGNGETSFTLHEEGKVVAGSWSLSCVLYDEEGKAGYTFTEDVDYGYSGSGSVTSKGDNGGTFTMTAGSLGSYSQTGGGGYGNGGYQVHETGTWSLDNVHLTRTTSGNDEFTFTSNLTQTYHSTGTMTVTDKGSGNASGNLTSSNNGTFTSTETFTLDGTTTTTWDQNAFNSFMLYTDGHQDKDTKGVFSVDSYVYDSRGDDSVGYHPSGTWTLSGGGNVHQEGSFTSSGLDSFGYQGSVTVTGNSDDTFVYSGSGTYTLDTGAAGSWHLHEEGKAVAGQSFPWSLSSFLYDEQGNDSYVVHQESKVTREGDVDSLRVSTSADGYGYSAGQFGTGTFTLTVNEKVNYFHSPAITFDSKGNGSYTLHEEGSYANGSFSLSSHTLFEGAFNSFVLLTNEIRAFSGEGTVVAATTSTTGYSGAYSYGIGGIGWQSSSKAWGDSSATLRFTGSMAKRTQHSDNRSARDPPRSRSNPWLAAEYDGCAARELRRRACRGGACSDCRCPSTIPHDRERRLGPRLLCVQYRHRRRRA